MATDHSKQAELSPDSPDELDMELVECLQELVAVQNECEESVEALMSVMKQLAESPVYPKKKELKEMAIDLDQSFRLLEGMFLDLMEVLEEHGITIHGVLEANDPVRALPWANTSRPDRSRGCGDNGRRRGAKL